jgi:hypothetical protein
MRKYLLAAVAALALGVRSKREPCAVRGRKLAFADPQLGQRLRLLRPKHVHAPVIRY